MCYLNMVPQLYIYLTLSDIICYNSQLIHIILLDITDIPRHIQIALHHSFETNFNRY